MNYEATAKASAAAPAAVNAAGLSVAEAQRRQNEDDDVQIHRGPRPGSLAGLPITKLPAGMPTISGQLEH